MSKRKANLLLLTVAILWGASYIFVRMAINAGMQSGMINAVRGSMCVVGCLIVFNKSIRQMTRFDFKAGLLMGITNFIAYYLQTDGLRFTTPAKNAFITTMYVALSPLLLWIFWHERPRRKTYFVIPLALIGMGILTNVTASGLALNYGDLLTLISSIFWALQLIFFGKIASKASSPWIIIFMIGLIQGIAGWCVSFTTETQTFAHIHWIQALIPVALLAILVTFVAQGLQITAQKYTDATSAGLLLMLESFFASVLSVILGYDSLTHSLIIGGAILLLANAIMQTDLHRLSFLKRTN
ncbi:DMT family transporter [Limosilactobacillus vaginalis]|uniref:DMT family transporter n=1 Tax=Limosilactobacillus vaginalis TaxID=1633 RepID=UPI000BEEE615|nr:DMT family transporter [Limosilactobacillus vaginalis]PEH05354.1 EamA family transporter [Lactobacillus sp. UMNPBX5]